MWIAHAICGVFMAFVAFLLHLFEDSLIEYRMQKVQELIDAAER